MGKLLPDYWQTQQRPAMTKQADTDAIERVAAAFRAIPAKYHVAIGDMPESELAKIAVQALATHRDDA